MDFNINKFAFLYSDYQYFQWFKAKTKRQLTYENHLQNVIRWKGLQRRFRAFKEKWAQWNQKKQEITINEKSWPDNRAIVTRAFLSHLNNPTEYPILDKYVFEAMRDLKQKYREGTNKNISDWKKDYEGGYKEFFKEFYEECGEKIDSIKIPCLGDLDINKEIIKRRILDRALWEYGQILSKQESKNC